MITGRPPSGQRHCVGNSLRGRSKTHRQAIPKPLNDGSLRFPSCPRRIPPICSRRFRTAAATRTGRTPTPRRRRISQDYEDELDEGTGPPDERLPPEEAAVQAAANRTNAPGIFLILCGVFNLLGVALWGVGGFIISGMTVDQLEMSIEQNQQVNSPFATVLEAQVDQIIRQKTGKDPRKICPPTSSKRERREAMQGVVKQQKQGIWQLVLLGTLNLAAAMLPILAGIRMHPLRSYGLSVTGAIVAAIPCLSVAGCPCFLGLIFGIWAAHRPPAAPT